MSRGFDNLILVRRVLDSWYAVQPRCDEFATHLFAFALFAGFESLLRNDLFRRMDDAGRQSKYYRQLCEGISYDANFRLVRDDNGERIPVTATFLIARYRSVFGESAPDQLWDELDEALQFRDWMAHGCSWKQPGRQKWTVDYMQAVLASTFDILYSVPAGPPSDWFVTGI